MTGSDTNFSTFTASGGNFQFPEVGEPVTCVLKWFNESKGFGFVYPQAQQGMDAFVHVCKLQDAKIKTLGEGARLLCELDQTERGLSVTRVVRVLDAGDFEAKTNKIPLPITTDDAYELEGEVKWYCPRRGYGFLEGRDGRKDVFIHQTCVTRNGISETEMVQGAKLDMMIRDVDQGREVVSVKLHED